MDEISNSSNEISNSSNGSEFKSANEIDLDDQKRITSNEKLNHQANKEDNLDLNEKSLKNNLGSDLNEMDLKNNLGSDLNEIDLKNNLNMVLNNSHKLTDVLANDFNKNLNEERVFKKEDENSNYESLNDENLNEEQEKPETFINILNNPNLSKRILKKGDESVPKPEIGIEVLINLEVRNYETNDLIESESGQNLTVFICDFDIIHGVDLALITMHKGEISEILVKPMVGYGTKGKLPEIPSDCILICKVELIKIIWPNEMVCESINSLLHYFNVCKRKKERGNFFFKREEYETSLKCYSKTSEILDFLGEEMVNRNSLLISIKDKAPTEERKKEIVDDINLINDLSIEYMKVKLDVFNNLTAVYMKIKSYNKALNVADFALKVSPNDLKALYRKSKILHFKGCIREAIACLKKALKIEPNNKTFISEFKKLEIKLKKEIEDEQVLCKKMFEPDSKIKQKINKKAGSMKGFNYLTTSLLLSGVVFGSYILYRKYAKS